MPAKDSIDKLCEEHPHLDPDRLRAKVKAINEERMKREWPIEWIAGILVLITALAPVIIALAELLKSFFGL